MRSKNIQETPKIKKIGHVTQLSSLGMRGMG